MKLPFPLVTAEFNRRPLRAWLVPDPDDMHSHRVLFFCGGTIGVALIGKPVVLTPDLVAERVSFVLAHGVFTRATDDEREAVYAFLSTLKGDKS